MRRGVCSSFLLNLRWGETVPYSITGSSMAFRTPAGLRFALVRFGLRAHCVGLCFALSSMFGVFFLVCSADLYLFGQGLGRGSRPFVRLCGTVRLEASITRRCCSLTATGTETATSYSGTR